MKEGYVDSTGVQDLFFEADATVSALLEAIEAGETRPERADRRSRFCADARQPRRARDGWICGAACSSPSSSLACEVSDGSGTSHNRLKVVNTEERPKLRAENTSPLKRVAFGIYALSTDEFGRSPGKTLRL